MISEDAYDLHRFVEAQARDYDRALAEIKAGRKRSHWMWYVFPQFAGLGASEISERYAIKSIAEAEAYLAHPLLGRRLIEGAEVTLQLEGRSARDIFGSPDDLKLRSCATLFASVSAPASVFHQIIEKYFKGKPDQMTQRLFASYRQSPDATSGAQ